MKPRSKALVGVCAALSMTSLLSQPAQAVVHRDVVQADVTFIRQGRSVTCTVEGFSYLDFTTEDGSYYGGETRLVDTDPACHESLLKTSVRVVLSRPERALAVSKGEGAVDYLRVDGYYAFLGSSTVPTTVIGEHEARFECDADPDNGCGIFIETAPK